MSEDMLSLIEFLKPYIENGLKILGSINIKLDKLVNQETIEKPAKKIVETLKAEEDETLVKPQKSPSMATTGLNTSEMAADSKPSDVVLMDLKGVTIMVVTDKAILVIKKGFQKWIPLSCVVDEEDWEDGLYLETITLTDAGDKWIHKKGWDKLEVRKR